MWCRNYSLAFAQGSRWMKGCSRWVERRAWRWRRREEESDGWLSGRVTARLKVLFRLFMSSRRFTPLSLSSLPPPSPFLLHSPLKLVWLFSLSLLLDDFPAPFMPFDFGSASFTVLLLSLLLFLSSPLTELMCSAVLDAQPGVLCNSVGVSFHSVIL